MKSVRIGATLEARLQEVARMTGDPVSRIIRQAIEERCELLLGEDAAISWDSVCDTAAASKPAATSRPAGRAGALRH